MSAGRRLPEADAQLIRDAIAGRRGAVDELAGVWLPHVYRWCHRLGGPTLDAEDAAHETLIVMCRRIHTVHGPAQFPSWLFAIARKTIANQRRRAWFARWVPGASLEREAATGWGSAQDLESRQSAEVVWKVLEALPQSQREVLVLVDLEEHTNAEAAALLGLPLGTVKSRLRVAREAFREGMRGIAFFEPTRRSEVG